MVTIFTVDIPRALLAQVDHLFYQIVELYLFRSRIRFARKTEQFVSDLFTSDSLSTESA